MRKTYKIACCVLFSIIIVLTLILFLYLQKTYTVVFDTKGGTIYPAIEVKPSHNFIAPPDPVREGYIFEGWYEEKNDTLYNFDNKVTNSLTLVAKWKSII